jgi:hypothetical protein
MSIRSHGKWSQDNPGRFYLDLWNLFLILLGVGVVLLIRPFTPGP